MPACPFRRAFALLALAALAAVQSACRDRPTGDVKVLVIGPDPKLRDPAAGSLTLSDAVVLASVAQGLVRFDASGNIIGGLAERWNVSDDGRSYIFRIAAAQWPDGRRITAQQVARALKRNLTSRSTNPLKDTLGAVEDIVAMTDRVIEIRLSAPRPNLLALLAQPEFGIYRNGYGTGPFTIAPERGPKGELRLVREILSNEGDVERREVHLLAGSEPREAVRAFARGEAHLVLGGTFADLPYARMVRLPRNSLRFEPASGLIGLLPTKAAGPFNDVEVRRLLNQAINRAALVTAMEVPGLAARATVLEPGLDGVASVAQPEWFALPMEELRPRLIAEANRLFGAAEKPAIRIAVPDGPGGERLLFRLRLDWGALGFPVEGASNARSADFKLVDAVAPSTSPAWFLRNFRCAAVPLCDSAADELLAAAREAQVPAQRYALLLQAAARIEEAQLFLPIAAPVRWSLVAARIQGFAGNRYARHTLSDLDRNPTAGGS